MEDYREDVVEGTLTLSTNVHQLVKDMDELLRPPRSGTYVSESSDNIPLPDAARKHDTSPQIDLTKSYIQELNSRSLALQQRLAALNLGNAHPAASGATTESPDEEMILQPGAGRMLADALQVHELEVEVERAVAQVQKSLAAEAELKDEKEKLEAAAKMGSKEPGSKER